MPIPSFDKENDTANVSSTSANPSGDTTSPTFTGVTGHEHDPAFSTGTVVNDPPTPGTGGFPPSRGFPPQTTTPFPATDPVVVEDSASGKSPAFAAALKDTDAAAGTKDDVKIEAQRTAVANLAGHNVHPTFPQGYDATGNVSGTNPPRIVHAVGVITNDERAELDAKLVAALSTTPKPEKITTTDFRSPPRTTTTTETTKTQTEPVTKPTPFTPTQPRDAGMFP